MMNKDNAKDFLPLVQALAEGKTIQFKGIDNDTFEDIVGEHWFDDEATEYRIKPEPKKEWIRVGKWNVGTSMRCYASCEEDETRLQNIEYFGGWITDRIEYELPEGEV
jgi:hypothetical protein